MLVRIISNTDISKVEADEVIQLTIVHCIMEAELISCL